MAAIHEALKTLLPTDFNSVRQDDLKSYMTDTFKDAQLLIDSIPIPAPSSDLSAGRLRSDTSSSVASSASEISSSSARPTPPSSDVEVLQKAWGKPVRLNAKENPLGMSVYKLAGKDGKGAWFARRSVHEGLGFKKWKQGLEREFPETMKTQGSPGEGNIRGIGGEKRLEYQVVDGVGKLEVYHLSAQFPGPTTPRDFVTLLLTSDSALDENTGGVTDSEIPRHFMVVSKPCIHDEAQERDGFIRGQYQSVEFIREIPLKKPKRKSASTTDLTQKSSSRNRSDSTALGKVAAVRHANKVHGDSQISSAISEENLPQNDKRDRGHTISFAGSRGKDAKGEHLDVPSDDTEEDETNPVEWIMLTRSDPGGSVPRFMVERGTPSSIVADATKFLDWACVTEAVDNDDNREASDLGEISGEISEKREQNERKKAKQQRELFDYQTNGHLAGLDGARDPAPIQVFEQQDQAEEVTRSSGGLYSYMAGAASAAGAMVAAHTPAMISNHFPGYSTSPGSDSDSDSKPEAEVVPNFIGETAPPSGRRYSTSSSSSSDSSFKSAYGGDDSDSISHASPAASTLSKPDPLLTAITSRTISNQEKELQKLEDKRRKLDEKLKSDKEKELFKKREDSEKEAAVIAKAEEKHQREVVKQEEKYKREVEKLARKKERELQKVEERRRKAEDKDERTRLGRELNEVKAERDVLAKEMAILREQVGALQAENTALAVRVGRMGPAGEEVLKEVQAEVLGTKGRSRSASIKGLGRPVNPRGSSDRLGGETVPLVSSGLGKENLKPPLAS